MIKWDKEKTVLSVAGGIASLVLGYLIWRHEQSVEGQNAAAQLAAQQNIANEQAQEVQQELESIPSYEGGGGTTDDGSNADSATSSLETPPTDSTLESILQAFYGASGAGSTSSAGGTTVTPNDPTVGAGSTGPGSAGAGSTTATSTAIPAGSGTQNYLRSPVNSASSSASESTYENQRASLTSPVFTGTQ